MTYLKNSNQKMLAGWLLAGAVCVSGCAGPSLFRNSASADASIENVSGPNERGLQLVGFNRDSGARGGSDQDLALAQQQYEQAKGLYDQQDYAGAEKAFKKIVGQRRARYETFQTRFQEFWGVGKDSLAYNNFGDPVEEDSLYMTAECQYAQRKLTKAQDSYDDLLNRYPSTKHMDRVTRQLFRMARYWLDFPNDLEKKSDSEIQLVSNEEGVTLPQQSSKGFGIPLLPNFTDKTRPMYDAAGRGLQALRSIWLHDATGPLADDALMLSANHNLRVRNFIEAKRLYDLLREQYPDSPHIKDAYLLGSHVTLASYEGPEYDGRALADARDLKQTMIQIFPDLTPEERQRLQSEIDQMHKAEIERIWELVEFYQRKGTPPAIALHCNLLINRYPNSSYADRARQVLAEINGESHSGASIIPWSRGSRPTQTAQAPPRSERPTSPKTTTTPDLRLPASEAEPEKRSLLNFLKRSDQPPELQSPPPSGEARL